MSQTFAFSGSLCDRNTDSGDKKPNGFMNVKPFSSRYCRLPGVPFLSEEGLAA